MATSVGLGGGGVSLSGGDRRTHPPAHYKGGKNGSELERDGLADDGAEIPEGDESLELVGRLDGGHRTYKERGDEHERHRPRADPLHLYEHVTEVPEDPRPDLGYPAEKVSLKNNFDYYIRRTSHGSTLSRIVHAYLANELGLKELAWDLYMEALSSDYVDIQGGTTAEGIHAGVMGSTLLFVIQSIAGIRFMEETLSVSPSLPAGWKKISFNFAFRKKYYTFDIFLDRLAITVNAPDDQLVEIEIAGKTHGLVPGQKFEVDYR